MVRYTPVSNQSSRDTLGKPQKKKRLDTFDALALLIALASLALAICAITPRLSLAWRLGFDGQIVLIGFLLSVMNICFKRIFTNTFILLEARYGQSMLQNYDAILRNSPVANNLSKVWALSLLLFLLLPIALSAAYKRFTGGYSSYTLPNTAHYYGLNGPPGTNKVGFTSLALMANATLPFLAASFALNASTPFDLEFPAAFGFNNLILDNHTAAFLDAPMEDFVSDTQAKLAINEFYDVYAPVNATVTQLNNSIDANRNNSAFWDPYWSKTKLQTNSLWNDWDIGLLNNQSNGQDTETSFCGIMPSAAGQGLFIQSDPESKNFMQYAFMLSSRRERCSGTWRIAKTSVQLLSGSCTGELTYQGIFHTWHPREFYSVYMPFLSNLLGQLTPSYTLEDFGWTEPSFVNAIAAMYWSAFAMQDGFAAPRSFADGFTNVDMDLAQQQEIYYEVADTVLSNTPALRSDWLLYLVLALQPFLMLVALGWTMAEYKLPLSDGFGLIAILSGVDRSNLDVLSGASLSGKLARPVPMRIAVKDRGSSIRYQIDRSSHGMDQIQSDQVYS